MLKTYLTIAYRNFARNKVFSLIHILGLSIGISAALVIVLIVHYDFTFDKFEKNRDQLYRVVMEMNSSGNKFRFSGVPSPFPETVSKEVTGVEEVVSFHSSNGDPKVTIPEKTSKKPFSVRHQSHIALTENSYFNLVPYEWLAGSKKTALDEPFKVVLTAERAKTYFPSVPYESMIGKQIVYDDTITLTVSGIVKDLRENSDFIFKEFISLPTIPAIAGWKQKYNWTEWGSVNGGSQCILRLGPNASVKKTEALLQGLDKKYLKARPEEHSTRSYGLQPFDDIHFNAEYGSFGEHTANKNTLYGLLAVAAFLLTLACINFINLSTAQAGQRAKEIGVRKTLGSTSKQLMGQFLTETFFISFVALIFSILLVPLLLKVFSDFIPSGLHLDLLQQPFLIGFALLLTAVVALLAGFYPALFLSRFKPVAVLKNQRTAGPGNSRNSIMRKTLTISQFLIAQVFTMATLIAVKQIHYLVNKDMGFKKDAIGMVETPFTWDRSGKPNQKRIRFFEEIKKLPGVQLVSMGGGAPAESGWSSQTMSYKDGKKENVTDVRQKYGDTSYLKLYHIPLLAGRNIQASDTANEYVINETYLHILGFQKPQDAINKQLNDRPIVGVMADFNQESLHASIKPTAFSSEMANSLVMHIALTPGAEAVAGWKNTIASISKSFKEIYPDEDFQFNFLDESIEKFYKSEKNLSSLLKWASGLAIFISCMGLLGLVMYTTSLRTKEIGIRKVLGASVSHIVSILSRDFVQLVLIASFIAIPLSWWAMHKWMEGFAYKTPVSWWLFVSSTLFMLFVALITLSIQTIRAASANPVESLRSE